MKEWEAGVSSTASVVWDRGGAARIDAGCDLELTAPECGRAAARLIAAG